jgi:hypothetical protein
MAIEALWRAQCLDRVKGRKNFRCLIGATGLADPLARRDPELLRSSQRIPGRSAMPTTDANDALPGPALADVLEVTNEVGFEQAERHDEDHGHASHQAAHDSDVQVALVVLIQRPVGSRLGRRLVGGRRGHDRSLLLAPGIWGIATGWLKAS